MADSKLGLDEVIAVSSAKEAKLVLFDWGRLAEQCRCKNTTLRDACFYRMKLENSSLHRTMNEQWAVCEKGFKVRYNGVWVKKEVSQ